MADPKMQKLYRSSLLALQSGYLTEDHLLIVEGRFQERYKRLRYADIQALLIRRTATGKVMALLGGLCGLLFLLLTLTQLDSGAWVAWGVMTVIAWSTFAYFLRGRGSAQMGVQTSVQTVILESVTNLRKAERVAALLSARVESVQGPLEPEALRAALDKWREEHNATYTRAGKNRLNGPPPLKQAPPPLQLESE